jgi:hypothetical protein
MDDDRGDKSAHWLSFGAESVPLRDSSAQEVEREQSKRLRLIEVLNDPDQTSSSARSVLRWWVSRSSSR